MTDTIPFESCLQIDCGKIKTNHPLAPYSTFGIGGNADYFAEPANEEELHNLFSCIVSTNIPFVIIGGGSNILISDNGFPGVVIHPNITSLQQKGTRVTVGSGYGLQKFLLYLRDHGLSGLEHLAGIPGCIGGALAGNAGTPQHWINEAVVEVRTINTETAEKQIFTKDQCDFSYRNSIFKDSSKWCIYEGVFELHQDTPEHITERMTKLMKKRNKQPAGDKSAGCVFKNPQEASAGKLIDELGLKGKKIGNIQISHDHGNFMLNLGGGKAEDVIKLISYVKQQVRDKRGIQLQEEVRYIGF